MSSGAFNQFPADSSPLSFFWELIPETLGLRLAWLKLLIDKQQEDGESQE